MMFTPMRRAKQEMSQEEVLEILGKCPTAVLAVNTEKGYPYTVPLNFVYDGGKIYFHCGKKGLKVECLNNDDRVALCIVDSDRVVPETFSTDYTSVVVFGKARILEEDTEKLAALRLLNGKFSPDYRQEGEAEIKRAWQAVMMVEITVEQMTGKKSCNRI